MRIVVCGLGHVGVVTAAALLREGHTVIGVDNNAAVCDVLGRGLAPFREPDIGEIIAAGHAEGRLSIAAGLNDIAEADVAFICVGTGGLPDGSLDLEDLRTASQTLGEAVRLRAPDLQPILLVFRSTMLPGTMTTTVMPALLAAIGEPSGRRYNVAYHPEFMREGCALADYFAPARIVIGEQSPGTADKLKELYAGIDAPIVATSLETAELIKFADNSFHALKVCFANEVGRLAASSGISPSELFQLFCMDTKLNLSAAYLRPGGAFGGPCLSKDIQALAHHMKVSGISAPIIDHIVASNQAHTDFLIAEIKRRAPPRSRILLVGLSFKANTDDIRQSPLADLAQQLLTDGYDLAVYDSDLVATGDGKSRLAPWLAKIAVQKIHSDDTWDLAVIGRNQPDAIKVLNSSIPLFNIDRL
ncbi:MAG: nucleotide sugar dehydrogenase [Afipia sp.]|jgi:GDP-mannose 6-dehydrogenase|nr:nucleotide sugar dehydrogenase [Afipia sp.]MBS4004520.1 nucleotide sugar dehydrogenase [Afipia sp.]WIG50579.1 MAG: UDP-glucose 6-dehydrogenase [Afipia sp.]